MLKKTHSRYFHLKYLLESLKGVNGKVIDVGCGEGWILEKIGTPNLGLYGCDIKKSKNMKFNFKICSAEKLKYKKQSFDFAIMTDVLEHLKNPEVAIKEVAKILKPKSKFHLVVPLEAEPFSIDGMVKHFFNKNQKRLPIGHIQQFKLSEIEKLLNTNGFNILKIRYSYHFIYQLISFFYFTKINLFDDGKYKPLKANQGWIDFIGVFVYIEDLVLSRFKGQEAHILAIKK